MERRGKPPFSSLVHPPKIDYTRGLISEQERSLDEALYDVVHRFRAFDHLHPINRLEEKEKFLLAWKNGEHYQPQYEYPNLPVHLDQTIRRLGGMEFPTTPYGRVLGHARDEYLDLFRLVSERATDEFANLTAKTFGAPNPDLVAEAKGVVKKDTFQRRPIEVGVKALSETLRLKLREERIEGWEIAEDPLCVDTAEVDPVHHKIRLPTGLLLSKKGMRRLRYRLIQVHLYRALNGERQPLRMFRTGLDGSWAQEEALAMDHEQRMGFGDSALKHLYAGKLWACALALKHSFYGVFSRLENHFDLETAYNLAEAVKRGLVNTAQPGGWIREHTCFLEQKKISHLNTEDVELLYLGRISVHHLPLAKEMISHDVLIPPAFLPKNPNP